MVKLSIVIPMLNEAGNLPGLMEHLLPFSRRGHEIIFVDGGSKDNSVKLVELIGFRVLHSDPGRARQMNAGAAAAQGAVLLFLHADTRLPPNADRMIEMKTGTDREFWGRFDVHIKGKPTLLRSISLLMNLRSRLTGIATGDQAIFISRSLFKKVGGFPEQPLMEDVEISRRLRRWRRPVCLRQQVRTSGRRWEQQGVWNTIFLMWRLRLMYWLGVSPDRLVRLYQ